MRIGRWSAGKRRLHPRYPHLRATLRVASGPVGAGFWFRFDWLIPGLLREKIEELIRSLPKPIRVQFVPVTDTAIAAAAQLTQSFAPLIETLADWLSKRTGNTVRKTDFDLASLPPFLQMNFRVIDEPVLRLTSVDLDAATDVTALPEVFDFARDYLGLIKAALIASGVVPPGMEGCELPISELLSGLVGPGLGLEIVSKVNNIPKGSRLAVSTNLNGTEAP